MKKHCAWSERKRLERLKIAFFMEKYFVDVLNSKWKSLTVSLFHVYFSSYLKTLAGLWFSLKSAKTGPQIPFTGHL